MMVGPGDPASEACLCGEWYSSVALKSKMDSAACPRRLPVFYPSASHPLALTHLPLTRRL